MSRINVLLRRAVDRRNRKRLKNKDFSIFSINCTGGCMSHDLGLEFRSPFVNLFLWPEDYLKFLSDPQRYLSLPLEFTQEQEISYPVARLGDVTVYFKHYETEEQARAAWQRRTKRVNWENLFVLMTDRDGCTEDHLRRFDALPYRNKVVFTHVPRPDLSSAAYIPGFEKDGQVGVCTDFIGPCSGKKVYDRFDYVKWFNEGK